MIGADELRAATEAAVEAGERLSAPGWLLAEGIDDEAFTEWVRGFAAANPSFSLAGAVAAGFSVGWSLRGDHA